MSDPRITYAVREGVTPEEDLQALANVYAFALRCHQEKHKNRAARPGGPEDGTEAKEDSADARIPQHPR